MKEYLVLRDGRPKLVHPKKVKIKIDFKNLPKKYRPLRDECYNIEEIFWNYSSPSERKMFRICVNGHFIFIFEDECEVIE